MDLSAARKRTKKKSIAAPTANSVNGVLILDVASVSDRESMSEKFNGGSRNRVPIPALLPGPLLVFFICET